MAGEQRKCANCRYFQDAEMSGNGWCTHPKRQFTSDVKLLVRAGELACRNSWGGDLYQSPGEYQADHDDANADLPGSSREPDRDDEVTSVTFPAQGVETDTLASNEDRVVSDRPAPHHDDEADLWNEAARHDQDERARIMARGNKDAVRHARERHTYRRSRFSRDSSANASDSDQHGGSSDRVVTQQVRFSSRFRRADSAAEPALDDTPVPRSETKGRFSSNLPEDRFDSVPEIDPGFDLPGWSNKSAEPAETDRREPEANELPFDEDPVDDDKDQSTYALVLQRARRAREQRRLAMQPLRHGRPRSARDDAEVDVVEHDNIFEVDDAGSEVPLEPEQDDLYVTAEAFEEVHDAPKAPLDDWEAVALAEDTAEATDFAHYDDMEPREPSQRPRGGWLSRLGIRRRSPRHDTSFTHDVASVTRHEPEYDHDDAFEGEAWLQDRDREQDEHTQDQWLPAASHEEWVDDAEELPHVASQLEVAFEERSYLDEPYDPETARYDGIDTEDDIGDWSTDTVIAAEADNPRNRRTPASWHRVREDHVLPDLDDNLFGESFDRSPSTATATALLENEHQYADHDAVSAEPPEPPRSAGQLLESRSPRDSFFRARQFMDRDVERQVSRQPVSPALDYDPEPDDASKVSEEAFTHLPDLDEHDFDLRELVARGNELIDMTIDIAPDIPRECRTCRSFRSAEGGARGWCTNEWAFTHRRMVNEDDLACETTIGCWWLPDDRYWVIQDEDGYAAPTPRMDELIARHEQPSIRRASGT